MKVQWCYSIAVVCGTGRVVLDRIALPKIRIRSRERGHLWTPPPPYPSRLQYIRFWTLEHLCLGADAARFRDVWITARLYPHAFKIYAWRQLFRLYLIILPAFNYFNSGYWKPRWARGHCINTGVNHMAGPRGVEAGIAEGELEQLEWCVEWIVESCDLFQCSHCSTPHMYPVRVPAEDLSMLSVEKRCAAHDRNQTHSFHKQSIDQSCMTPAVENSLRDNERTNT
jgi:hypothetical protein